MKIETVKIETLSLDPANARDHSKRNLEAIRASLKRYGQQKPIVVDGDGIIVAGNGTFAAAKIEGWDKIAVVRTKLKGAEAIAYAIADNRSAELAEWNFEVLGKVLASLQEDDPNIGLELGWAEHELVNIVAADWTPAPADDDDLEGFGAPAGGEPEDGSHVAPLTVHFVEEELNFIERLIPEDGDAHDVLMALVMKALDPDLDEWTE